MKNIIYLDNAAATPLLPEVLEAMLPYFTDKFYNPSASYLAARQVAGDIAEARSSVASWLGARGSEIIFTAGGTEANNLAIHGVMSQYPSANMITTKIEHDAVLVPASQYAHKTASVNAEGLVNIDELESLIDEDTVLVSVIYANNEIGTIQPIRRIASRLQAIKEKRRQQNNPLPLYFHTDACQAAPYLDLHVNRLGVDMMSINAGKIYGPKQCGALYAHSSVRIQPLILGGGQEKGRRSGTENVANIIGFAKALSVVQSMRSNEVKRLQNLQAEFINLLEKNIKGVQINGSLKSRLPNNVHITIPGQDNERLMMSLDTSGIICAVGSACSASNEEPSHVLGAIGLSEEAAHSSLRFSMGKSTTRDDIMQTVDKLTEIIA